MNVERLIELIHASPFIPFAVLLPNGDRIRVPHSDYAWVHPERKTIIVVDENGRTKMLSRTMIVGLELREEAA